MLSIVRVTNTQKAFQEYSKALENFKTYIKYTWMRQPDHFLLPLPMKQKVQEKLKRLEKENIIHPVKMPTDWCAPILAVWKNNGKVRLCCQLHQTQ